MSPTEREKRALETLASLGAEVSFTFSRSVPGAPPDETINLGAARKHPCPRCGAFGLFPARICRECGARTR